MKTTSPADSKNIEIVEQESEPRIMRPTDALQYVVERIGIDKVMNGSVRHLGAKLLVRHPFKINLNTYKKIEDDLYLNRKGTATDKFRTITILNSVHRLNFVIRLTTEPPTKIRKPKSADKLTRKPKINRGTGSKEGVVEVAADLPAYHDQPMLLPDESDFVFGSDGVLNLFDD